MTSPEINIKTEAGSVIPLKSPAGTNTMFLLDFSSRPNTWLDYDWGDIANELSKTDQVHMKQQLLCEMGQ